MQVHLSEDGESYLDEAGDHYTRVSRVLSGCGLVRGFYGSSSYYCDRGRAVHLACELINRALTKRPEADPEAILRPETVDPRVRPYVGGYLKFLREILFVPSAFEISLGSIHGFAGTIDIVGMLNGQLSIIDIKTGESIDPGVEYQTAAYEVLWHENYPTQLVRKKFALQLKANGLYKLHRLQKVSPSGFLEKWDEFLQKAA